MRNALALALVLAASSAAAQPAMTRDTCAVTIVRAPEDVKNVVESWVKAEPKCSVRLEIRIVPTDGGLYLIARDDYGRLRERVVPDAQSAGVIVASWVAADSNAQTPYDVRQPEPAPEPMLAPSPLAPAVAPAAPGVAPAAMPSVESVQPPGDAPVIAPTAPAVVEKPRWFSLGGLVAMSGTGGGGVRGEWDIKQKSWATLGIAASLTGSGISYYGGYDGYGEMYMADAKALGYLALDGDWGKWHLRTSVGIGLVYTEAEVYDTGDMASGVFPTGELTLSLTRELTRNWALGAGPIVSIYAQQYNLEQMGPNYYYGGTETRALEAMMYLSVRHRL